MEAGIFSLSAVRRLHDHDLIRTAVELRHALGLLERNKVPHSTWYVGTLRRGLSMLDAEIARREQRTSDLGDGAANVARESVTYNVGLEAEG